MVQHTHTAEMDQEYAAFKEAFIRSLSPEERLAGMSPDDPEYAAFKEAFLKLLSPDERLAGMSLEDMFEALTAEQRTRLLKLAKREPTSPPEQ